MKLGKIVSVVRNVSTCCEGYPYHMGCTVQYEHGVRRYSFNIPSTAKEFMDDSVKNKRVKKLYTRRYRYYYADEFY